MVAVKYLLERKLSNRYERWQNTDKDVLQLVLSRYRIQKKGLGLTIVYLQCSYVPCVQTSLM